jgi:hypothetical protein
MCGCFWNARSDCTVSSVAMIAVLWSKSQSWSLEVFLAGGGLKQFSLA